MGAKRTSAVGNAAAYDGNGARGHCKRKNWSPLIVALGVWQQTTGGHRIVWGGLSEASNSMRSVWCRQVSAAHFPPASGFSTSCPTRVLWLSQKSDCAMSTARVRILFFSILTAKRIRHVPDAVASPASFPTLQALAPEPVSPECTSDLVRMRFICYPPLCSESQIR